MPTLYVLIGPIASGKSTFSRRMAADGAVVINDDSIVTALHGGDYSLYDTTLKPLYKSVEHHIILTALALGRDVVVDRPNHRRSTRMRYVGLAKSVDALTCGVMFSRHSPEVHARRRFDSDARGKTLEYWEKVALTHNHVYERVDHEVEGFDKVMGVYDDE